MSEVIRQWFIKPILNAILLMQLHLSNVIQELKMDQIQLVGKLNKISDTLDIVSDESKALITEVKTLKEAVAAAGQTSPAVDAALAAVEARTAAIDALVPNVA